MQRLACWLHAFNAMQITLFRFYFEYSTYFFYRWNVVAMQMYQKNVNIKYSMQVFFTR